MTFIFLLVVADVVVDIGSDLGGELSHVNSIPARIDIPAINPAVSVIENQAYSHSSVHTDRLICG
jgi:hypothetical protein